MQTSRPIRDIPGYLAELPNYLSFFILPCFISTLSPILIEMGRTLDADPRNLNFVLLCLTAGTIIGRFTLLFYKTRFKGINFIIISYPLLLVFTILLYFSRSLYTFYILYFFSGYILGAAMVIASDFLLRSPVKNDDRLITIASSFLPAGFITGLLVSPAIIKNGLDWKNIYILLVAIITMTLVLYVTITKKRKYAAASPKGTIRLFKDVFRDRSANTVFVIIFFIMIFYVTAEFVISNWTPTFLRMERSFDIQMAGIIVTVFWVSVVLGRIIISYLTARFSAYSIMITLSALSLFSSVSIMFAASINMAFISITILGLSISGLWPLIIYSGGAVYKKGRGTLLNMVFLASSAGTTLAPYLTRTISRTSMLFSMATPAIFMALVLMLLIVIIIIKKKAGMTAAR